MLLANENLILNKRMSGSDIFFGLMIISFFVIAFATFYYISTKMGKDDTKAEVSSAIKTIAISNIVLVGVMSIVSYIYINNNPLVKSTYTLVMLHLTLLCSITAVSIASIEKLS